jgi:hypothetical protein
MASFPRCRCIPRIPRNPRGIERERRRASGLRDDDPYAALTQVLGNRALNEVKVGYNDFTFQALPSAVFPDHPGNPYFPSWAVGRGAPRITFSGFSIGQAHTNAPQQNGQVQYSFRDDYRT